MYPHNMNQIQTFITENPDHLISWQYRKMPGIRQHWISPLRNNKTKPVTYTTEMRESCPSQPKPLIISLKIVDTVGLFWRMLYKLTGNYGRENTKMSENASSIISGSQLLVDIFWEYKRPKWIRNSKSKVFITYGKHSNKAPISFILNNDHLVPA